MITLSSIMEGTKNLENKNVRYILLRDSDFDELSFLVTEVSEPFIRLRGLIFLRNSWLENWLYKGGLSG